MMITKEFVLINLVTKTGEVKYKQQMINILSRNFLLIKDFRNYGRQKRREHLDRV